MKKRSPIAKALQLRHLRGRAVPSKKALTNKLLARKKIRVRG